MKTMKELHYHFGLKMRIYPSSAQKTIIKVNSDTSRFVYNEMNALNKKIYQLKKEENHNTDTQEQIKQLKIDQNAKKMSARYFFLRDKCIDSLAKANAIQNYRKSWARFHKVHHSGIPNFHKKNTEWKYQTNCLYQKKETQALLTNGSVRFIDDSHIKVPKLEILRASGSQKRILQMEQNGAEIRIGTVTVHKDAADRFFLSMQLGSDTPFTAPAEKTEKQVGIDLNIENFLTDSDGVVVDNPCYYRKAKKKLAKAQRKLSRRATRAKKEHRPLRDAKNYQKQRLLVARLYGKVRNQRQDFLHNLSTTLIKNHDLVAAEELRSRNLLKNHALSMSISDVGWRTFLNMLDYKSKLYGKVFVTVDPKNTTQTCSDCGFVMGTNGTEKLTLSDREWICPHCGTHHIRDWNAAKNILDRGLQKIKEQAV